MQSIQIQQSMKQKYVSEFFPAFLEFILSFEGFEKKDDSHSLCISEITDCKMSG